MALFRQNRRKQTSPLNAVRRAISLEPLETRKLFAALPLGATAEDTGEFMLGRIAVVPVLFESNGGVDANTESWTAAEIDAAIAKVRTGVEWWAEALDRLGTVHDLEFVIDETFARNPFATAYEPISRTSQESTLYLTPFLRAQGINKVSSLEDGVRQFNHAARERLGTDWAFTVFLVDSSADADGAFGSGSEFNIAFAYPGGLYMVSPSTRPASTISHEMGHIFWARDEYPGGGSWTDRRGYYNAQNLNASDNPTTGFVQEVSIMRAGTVLAEAYRTYAIPASTRAMIGWLDSDGDGIFDVADVPLHLEGEGQYNSATGVFTFDGNARAVPLPNRNSAGPQNDITLNRIDQIQYRLDNGPWLTASTIGAQVADVHFELTVAPFSSIELRVIDNEVGVTSRILSTNSIAPIVSGASIGGYAFVDANGEGENDPSDTLLPQVAVTLAKADGTPLLRGSVIASDYAAGPIPRNISGATISADGITLDGRVGSFVNQNSDNQSVFHFFNLQSASWQKEWAKDRQFVAEFNELVGRAQVDVIGIYDESSFGRLEAYDDDGNLITRVTSIELREGQSATLTVEDPLARIKSIRAFGHGASNVAIDHLRFGVAATAITDASGAFRFPGVPDGSYVVSFASQKTIHRATADSTTVTIVNGVSSPVAVAFNRIPSPWQNATNHYDVDRNGSVQPLDALRIINEIARNGARVLPDTASISHFYDTSDDGLVTALDALRVINELSRRRTSGASGEAANADSDVVFAGWDPVAEKQRETISKEDFSILTEQTERLRF